MVMVEIYSWAESQHATAMSHFALQAVFKWPSAALGVCFTQEA